MTEATPGTPQGVKTLGIKLPDELHAQLVLIAQLDSLSLTDAIRQAIDYYIERKRGEGNLAERAAQALGEIEREAAMRRDALQALFGSHAQTATPPVSVTTPDPATPDAAPPEQGKPTSRRSTKE
ncbi:MAG: hypothetical protein QOE61_698 [Micromonosporaceae bacterium]|nr:hypothetical protein [Micromonosporaceae bacterium]